MANYSDAPPMRVLFALASTNQMYSGIGRTIKELATRLTGRIKLEFAMDDWNPKNVTILREFAAAHGFEAHIGRNRRDDAFCDPLNEALPALLARQCWDAIEIVGWANAGTHSTVLDGLGDAVLVYTPHHQPIWTVPMPDEQAQNVADVDQRILERADVVLCDSPWERDELQARVPWRSNCQFLPLGCNFETFQSGPEKRKPQLLFIGDLAERRKRFDRVLGVFERLLANRPALRLVVIGNRSDQIAEHLPATIRWACDLRGYISESELRKAYAESQGLLLLSDFEAFGLPSLEALVSGTPIFLNRQAATESLFRTFRGANFCPAEDLDATTAIIGRSLDRGREAISEVIAERDRLQSLFDWRQIATRKWNALASAWFQRKHLVHSIGAR
jgi:glycosyltransferase involved in cell wall biosynthesis